MSLDGDNEIELLKGILNEVQDLNHQLARTDERSRNNQSNVERLREDRIEPLESQADKNTSRSRRNSLILGAAISIGTMIFAASLTYFFTLL